MLAYGVNSMPFTTLHERETYELKDILNNNESRKSPACTGVGGLYGGGGEKGGAPGQGFVVPGPHKLGLFAKLKKKRSKCDWEKHQGLKR
jgi:hypothetical protein